MSELPELDQPQSHMIDRMDEEVLLRDHVIVATLDIHGKFINVSGRFCKLCQYSEEELLGNRFNLLDSGYHSEEYFEEMHTQTKQGFIWQGEFRNKAKDGSIFWVDQTTIPMKNQQGEIDRYIAIQIDITKHQKIEKKLRSNFDLLNTTFESFPGAISVFDEDLVMTMVNKNFYNLLDLPEERFP
ncbi:MAG: PAS domain-containing protein, partial [Alphaproteobacteria bacterium]